MHRAGTGSDCALHFQVVHPTGPDAGDIISELLQPELTAEIRKKVSIDGGALAPESGNWMANQKAKAAQEAMDKLRSENDDLLSRLAELEALLAAERAATAAAEAAAAAAEAARKAALLAAKLAGDSAALNMLKGIFQRMIRYLVYLLLKQLYLPSLLLH